MSGKEAATAGGSLLGVKAASKIGDPALGTVRRVAEVLAISERSVWRLVAGGRLRAVKIGAARRIDMASVRTFVQAGGTGVAR